MHWCFLVKPYIDIMGTKFLKFLLNLIVHKQSRLFSILVDKAITNFKIFRLYKKWWKNFSGIINGPVTFSLEYLTAIWIFKNTRLSFLKISSSFIICVYLFRPVNCRTFVRPKLKHHSILKKRHIKDALLSAGHLDLFSCVIRYFSVIMI